MPEPPGANCSDGGEAIETGFDTNGNGVLDDNEVSATTYVCAPAAAEPALISVAPEPAGSNCAHGGTVVHAGLDTNGDGTLESNEVTSTSYVCVPPATLQQLVAVTSEPEGPHCASGGKQIDLGYDLDGDGVLESDEVSSVSYVCSGVANALVSIVTEPAGLHCAAGGIAILGGVDANDDGILEPAEVQSTAYSCAPSPTIEGDYVIHVQADIDALAGITAITGALSMDSPTVTSLSLPDLITLGSFTCDGVGNTDQTCLLTEISMPSLQAGELGVRAHLTTFDVHDLRSGEVGLQDALITTLDLSKLVSGEVSVERTPLVALMLPNFTTGDVDLEGGNLPRLDLPSLSSGGVGFSDCGPATAVSIPHLPSGLVSVTSCPNVAELDVPELATGQVDVTGTHLSTLQLPSFVSGVWVIENNPVLTAISAPVVQSIQYGFIEDNVEYPTCDAIALWTELDFPDITISGNDGAATNCH